MKLATFKLVAVFTLTASLAPAAGLAFIEVPADATGPAIKALVWSPCAVAPDTIKLGAIVTPAARDCPIMGDKLPLIVISHGRSGGALSHHDTAERLADSSFIVAALNHPSDNSANPDRIDDIATMVERPLDIKRLIDFMLTASSTPWFWRSSSSISEPSAAAPPAPRR